MNITWINDTTAQGTTKGGYITLRSYRTPANRVRLHFYFSRDATTDLNLRAGERLLVGLDEDKQIMAFKQTLFGGNAIKASGSEHRLACAVTLPIVNLPAPQSINDDQVIKRENTIIIPFTFSAADFIGWKKTHELKAVA